MSESTQRTKLYLLGVSVTHSIAPKMHESIAKSLGLGWSFENRECPSVEDMLDVLNSPTTAGAVITMPYKQSVIPHLASLTPAAKAIGAVNNVYINPQDGSIHGSNTDWEGVRGCLRSGDVEGKGMGRPALVIGAGGACRAAVYTLYNDFGVRRCYIINRDVGEVEALKRDVSSYATDLTLLHIQTEAEAKEAGEVPFYIVGTVPDIEAKTASELEMRRVLEFWMRGGKGVLLDMCFKPRNTRTMKLGREAGWECVCGTDVIKYQVDEQWRLWTGQECKERLGAKEAWRVLDEQAEASTAINF